MLFNQYCQYLIEKNQITANLEPDSEEKRKGRSDNVEIISIKKFTPSTTKESKPLLNRWKRYEFSTKSEEQTEGRIHKGYIVLNGHNSVKDIFCSCSDFQFLWRYALTKGEIASWETYPKYKNIETNAPHTKKPSYVTNPGFDKRLCKHLIKMFRHLDI